MRWLGKARRDKALAILALLVVGGALSFLPAFGISVKVIQECHNQLAASPASITCVLASAVTSGDQILLGVTTDGSIVVSSITDTQTNTYTSEVTKSNIGATDAFQGTIYLATLGSSGASDTITINLSGTGNVLVDAIEVSGPTATVVTTASESSGGISSGSSYNVQVTAFTPLAGDFVYAYASAEPCGGTSTITYDLQYTSLTANGITEESQGNCKATGVKFKLSQANEYAVWSSSTTVAAFNPWGEASSITTNFGGHVECVIELTTNHYTTTTTTTSTSTVDLSGESPNYLWLFAIPIILMAIIIAKRIS